MNKIDRKAIEDVTCSDVGSLIEIRKTFFKYSDYHIGLSPEVLSMDEHEFKQLYPLIEQGNKHTGTDKNSLDEEYIIGVNPAYNPLTKKFEFCTLSTNDIDILLSLIQLVKEPIDWENLSNSFSKEEIINWCKKYTLPHELEEEHKICDTKNARFIYKSMRLEYFYKTVVELYLLFNLWRESSWDHADQAKKYALKLIEPYSDMKLSNTEPYNILLSTFIDSKLKSIYMRFVNFGTNKLFLDTDNIFSMCYFQLSNIITKSLESKKHLKPCKGCGKIYWGHGNSRYCKDCDRRTQWSREKRKTISGGKKDG